MDHLHTQKRSAKYRGPTTSDDYNARIEENYRDLLALVNKAGIMTERLNQSNRIIFHNLTSLSEFLVTHDAKSDYLTTQMLDEGYKNWTIFHDTSKIDNNRFNGTSFEIPAASRCEFQKENGKMVLPKIEGGSFSKLKMSNTDGTYVLPSTFVAIAEGVDGTADNTGAFVNTNDISEAVVGGIGNAWERNVVVSDISSTTRAEVQVYISVPTDLGVTADSNSLSMLPYPLCGATINSIEYTTIVSPSLTNSDGYEPLNWNDLYSGDDYAVGHIPPGNDEDDIIYNSGPLKFNFGNKAITALRITLSQGEYYTQDDNYIFTYGLMDLDLKYEKRLDSGKFIVRVDAGDGQTFSEAPDITPTIFNVSLAEIPYIFSYRVIWETSVDSDEYTLTPVPFSEKIWVEVTLNKTLDNATPELYAFYLD